METIPQQPETPESAQGRIAELKGDAAWTSLLFSGDAGAKAEWTKLHEVAFGTEQVMNEGMASEPAALVAPASPAMDSLLAEGDHGNGVFADGPLAEPPRGVWDYDFPMYGADATDEQLARELGIKTAAYEAGVPAFLASYGRTVIERNIRDGVQNWTTPEKSAWARGELERRHGSGAAQIIADSKKVVDRIDAKSADAYLLLCNSGALNCPDFIETLARVERHYYAKRA